MKNFKFLFLIFLLSLAGCSQEKNFTDYVNPFVGTDLHGHTFPGATVPFGFVQLSPDTRIDGWDGCSGYHYSDDVVYGFSHTHLSGTGCSDYGDILLMPVGDYDADTLNRDLYSSHFSHKNEKASPGFYSVYLDRWGIEAELTAGKRTGVHRYIYKDDAKLIIDLQHRDYLVDSDIRKTGDNAIEGFRCSNAWAQNQYVYFYIEFSDDIEDCRFFGKEGALLSFGDKEIIAKVGISSVSAKNARENLYAEMSEDDFDFDSVHESALELWNEYLSKIDVRGDGRENVEKLRTFYTAMYHTAISPNIYSDVNGQYRGMDRQIHEADGFDRYTVFSLWDTFRSLHPLFTLIERERTEDFLKSFLTIYNEGGKLPVWELSGHETNCMIGYNSVSVIADALAKGIDLEDAEDLLDAMIVSANKDEFGIKHYRRMYYVPADKEHESVSKTLEYAYDDWCIARVADLLYEKTADEKYAGIRDEYLKYSSSYINVFDPVLRFMRPMMGGMWMTPFRPAEVNNHYTEANSWQYSFFVPQDINGFIDLMGGDEAFCGKIDSLFTASSRTVGRTQVDITGLVGQYAHGNEPSHHIAYLYAYAGQHWKTTALVRHILEELYSSAPDGLCGNDDCGQMSAWYVLSAIGIYPVTPGSDIFVLSSPIFDNVKINLENGETFEINSRHGGNIDAAKYIVSASLNGEDHPYSYISFEDIIEGGELDLDLDRRPDKTFAAEPEFRPVSRGYEGFLRNPWYVAEGDTFADSLEVSIAGPEAGSRIYYCLNDPFALKQSNDYVLYQGPFTVRESTTVRSYIENDKGERTPVVEAYFHKLKDDMDIETLCDYNPQYNARGENGLIDGLRGSENWKTGGWQGFQATDFTAIVDLREVKQVNLIGSGYCQDVRSWIWMPKFVEYSVSEDGENYKKVGKIKNDVDEQDYNIQTKDFVMDLSKNPVKCRYIKVFAKNFGTIPSWHLGAGGEGFIFIDEIWVK